MLRLLEPLFRKYKLYFKDIKKGKINELCFQAYNIFIHFKNNSGLYILFDLIFKTLK